MKNIIREKLREIEKKEKVEIIYAAESGSRAWGFSSPDSDYDVRFIYKRPKEDYLKLDPFSTVIEWQTDDTFDISGWDIRKVLLMLYKSNPTVFEWNNSPVVYKTTVEWEELSEVINKFFISYTGLYHYFNTARTTYMKYLRSERVRLKKYFYALRPILASRWILSEGTPPPMSFRELCEKKLPAELFPEVNALLEMKMSSCETAEIEKLDKLNSFITEELDFLGSEIKNVQGGKHPDMSELNKIFLSLMK